MFSYGRTIRATRRGAESARACHQGVTGHQGRVRAAAHPGHRFRARAAARLRCRHGTTARQEGGQERPGERVPRTRRVHRLGHGRRNPGGHRARLGHERASGTPGGDDHRNVAAEFGGGLGRVGQSGEEAGLVVVGQQDVGALDRREETTHPEACDEPGRRRVHAHPDTAGAGAPQREQRQLAARLGEEEVTRDMQVGDAVQDARGPVGGAQPQCRAAVGQEAALGTGRGVDERDDRGGGGGGVYDETRAHPRTQQGILVPGGPVGAHPRQQSDLREPLAGRPAGHVGARTAR